MQRFIICRASAGSGKTYRLVREFITIAISTPSALTTRFTGILAITFTNKAATGMKERIMKQLRLIVDNDPDDSDTVDLVDYIAGDLGITPDEVTRRCRILHSSILHSYSDFSVSTIDSFVHRLVRSFAVDLHLPANFNIAIDKQDILQTIIDQLMSLVGTSGKEPVTRILTSFVESNMEAGKTFNVDSQIVELANKIFGEETPRYLSQLENIKPEGFLQIRDKMIARRRSYEHSLQESASEFLATCQQFGIAERDFPRGTVYNFMMRLASGDFSKLNEPLVTIKTAYATGVLYAKTASGQLRDAMQNLMPSFNSTYELMDSGLAEYNTMQTLLTNIFSLALLGTIDTLKQGYYQDNDIVHISEFNKSIDAQVADQPTPFIYERIGTRYTNYLIDEAQDNSRLQWHNFFPLLDEAMTYHFPSDTAPAGERSLVVGDGKQAIYRFRQGDVRQFMNLPQVDTPLHGKSLAANAHIDNLTTNFRTLDTVVNFNNEFFRYVIREYFLSGPTANSDIAGIYIGNGSVEEPELKQDSAKKGGFVSLTIFPTPENKNNLVPGTVKHERLYASVLQAIRHQVDDLHYNYKDIMILARKNKTLVGVSDYILSHTDPSHPIPLVSSESFLLRNSGVVQLLFTIFEYLHYGHQPALAANIVRLIGIIRRCEVPCGADDLADRESFVSFLAGIGVTLHPDYLISLSLYDCAEQMIRDFALSGIDTPHVATLLNIINTYSQTPHADLDGLIVHLTDQLPKASCSTSSELDAVRLMSVHKAKGLEERVVIYLIPSDGEMPNEMWLELPDGAGVGLPVAYTKVYPKSAEKQSTISSLFDEENQQAQLDRLNVLYVALTRPVHKLLVLGEEVTSEKPNKKKNDADKANNTAKATDSVSMLKTFVKQYAPVVCHTDDDIATYTVGDDCDKSTAETSSSKRKSKKREEKPIERSISTVTFPSWSQRVIVAGKSQQLLSPLLPDSRRYGILVHDILATVLTVDQVPDAVALYCCENSIPERHAQPIIDRIVAAISAPDVRRFFAPGLKVRCECPLVVNGEVRRPDRVVFFDDSTWVIDFKTGARTEKSHQEYERQVGEYASALKAMGFPEVQTLILYI